MDRGAMLVSGGAAMVALGAVACLIAFPAAPAPDLGGPVVATLADPAPGTFGAAAVDIPAPSAEAAPEPAAPAPAPASGPAEVVAPALPAPADGTTVGGDRDAWTGDRSAPLVGGTTGDGWYGDSSRDGWYGDGTGDGAGGTGGSDPGGRDAFGWGDRHGGGGYDRSGW